MNTLMVDILALGMDAEQMCIEAVRYDGYALEFVENQTLEICIEAVRQNGYALRYVKEQTEEDVRKGTKFLSPMAYETICLEAVRANGLALEYVKEQTEEI